MKWKKHLYLTHRWLGLVISLQLLAWSVGGLMFSVLDIDNVRGDWDRDTTPPPPLSVGSLSVSLQEAVSRAHEDGVAAEAVASVSLRTRFDGRVVYELIGADERPLAAVDAVTGALTRRISDRQAGEAALGDFLPEATVESVHLLERDPPLEYRGKPIPVYQVTLDHAKAPHIYVCPVTGDVITRRNKPWRVFDFFWMLHTMDYRGRDDFNHWLLTISASLAILTSASGLLMWATRVRWWRPLRISDGARRARGGASSSSSW